MCVCVCVCVCGGGGGGGGKVTMFGLLILGDLQDTETPNLHFLEGMI